MQLYDRGIRRRLAPMLGNNRRQLELAFSLLFSLPGTPMMQYGDEIGIGDNLRLPERECARTPMQWTSEAHAGFSTGRRVVRPVIDDEVYGFARVNVADQRRDPVHEAVEERRADRALVGTLPDDRRDRILNRRSRPWCRATLHHEPEQRRDQAESPSAIISMS
jgi:hypothetical protein